MMSTGIIHHICMLHSAGVGKTSITLRYIGNLFSPDVNPTIAASFFSFTVLATPFTASILFSYCCLV